MAENTQPTLFPAAALPPAESQRLPVDASIQAALGAFERHMEEQGFSINTRKAFASDVRLLGQYLGVGQPIGQIGTKNLNDFLNWLVYERGVPCSRKSYARRVTTLKVFFAWLHESGTLSDNPASAVIQISVTSPLPTLPSEDQIGRALEITRHWRRGKNGERKPDARPHLLLTLLLETAIKKTEAMAIVLNHIDRTGPGAPFLYVRYKNPGKRNKERKITLSTEWLEVLDEYLDQYRPADSLFTCTARNLEYVLSDVAEAAGLDKGLLSFENLRWVAALRDFKQDSSHDELRQKLGLSKITWRETRNKLNKLAAKERQSSPAT